MLTDTKKKRLYFLENSSLYEKDVLFLRTTRRGYTTVPGRTLYGKRRE